MNIFPNMKFLSVGDVTIEYEERGRGEPIVLVHGGVFSDWFVPLAATEALAGFRVVRVRRPGYGANRPKQHVSIIDHARLVAAVADELALGKAHWVGHSSSCAIVLQVAADRPELVQSLSLIEPAPTGVFQTAAGNELLPQFIGPAMGAFAGGDVADAFDTFLRGVGGDGQQAVVEGRLGKDGYERAIKESPFFFADELRAVQEWAFTKADASRLAQPTLILEGGSQPAHLGPMSHQVSAATSALMKNSEVVIIPGVNHLMPLQDPDALGAAVAAFARKHPR